MTTQASKAQTFRALHHTKGAPLILFNAWDAGSARTIAEAGAKAIATGSWSVAAAHGISDAENLPLDLVRANLARIVATTDLPVSLDFERGYGATEADVSTAIAKVVAAGAIGVNLEDGVEGGLRAPAVQAARIRAARTAAEGAGVPLFINARTDVFLQAPAKTHSRVLLDDALARFRLYADAGADGAFAPGLNDPDLISALCAETNLPVNIMMSPHASPRDRLAALGVARISHGPGPYRLAMAALKEAAQTAIGDGP